MAKNAHDFPFMKHAGHIAREVLSACQARIAHRIGT